MNAMGDYPIHNYYRPNYEWRASTAGIAALVGIAAQSQWLWPNAPIGGTLVGICSLVTVYRGIQGWDIYRHQRSLRHMPNFTMRSEDIPKAKGEMYAGRGFWWTQTHTQRLYQARLPENDKYRARNKRYEAARDFERKHPNSWISKFTASEHWLNAVPPMPPTYGDPAIHGVEPNERDIFEALSERVGHKVVLGTTRVGKTRKAELDITQDIHRGDVVITFDPKGDADLLKRMFAECKRAGREKDFWFFHLGYPEISDKYSPVSTVGRVTEIATRIANALPGEGNSAAFKQFAWGYVNAIARASESLGVSLTYESIFQNSANLDALGERYFEYWLNRDYPDWADDLGVEPKLLERMRLNTGRTTKIIEYLDLIGRKGWSDPVGNELVSILSNSKTKYQALINSLFPLLSKLTTGKMAKLLSPDWNDVTDKRRTFDWDKIMNMGGVVYVGLDALSDAEVSSAVGNAMFADLASTAGRRYKFGGSYGQNREVDTQNLKKVCIHADEFNELIGDEFVPLLNKAGGAGYQVTVYTQTWDDVEARIGNKSKAEQIGGNLNTLYMFRVKNAKTAEILTNQLRPVEIPTVTLVSGSGDVNDPTDSADFTSSAEDRLTKKEVDMLSASDLTQLPKGQCFALLEGGQLAKLRLPMPVKSEDDSLWPAHMNAVFEGMQAQYNKYYTDDNIEAGYNLIDWKKRYFDGQSHDGLTVEGVQYGQ
jgi:conjugative coupling factor TraD (TOL family)